MASVVDCCNFTLSSDLNTPRAQHEADHFQSAELPSPLQELNSNW